MADAGNPNDWACDDPDKPRGTCMLSADIVKNRKLFKDKKLWEKAKKLKRSDIWTAAGFGTTDQFDNWETHELLELGQAFGDKLGVAYSGVKTYGICCSCG